MLCQDPVFPKECPSHFPGMIGPKNRTQVMRGECRAASQFGKSGISVKLVASTWKKGKEMANIGALLKQEITRLSRREIRTETQTTKQASSQYRHDIAALKREMTTLKRQVALLQHRDTSTVPPSASDDKKVRFVAKGLRSQRSRLGLSAENYGKLVGVSAQSVYNWEQGHSTPRSQQLVAIAALRSIGKREAVARLEQAGLSGDKKSRPR
jgi:DNA-binding transcriptional regulator YiaG